MVFEIAPAAFGLASTTPSPTTSGESLWLPSANASASPTPPYAPPSNVAASPDETPTADPGDPNFFRVDPTARLVPHRRHRRPAPI